MREHFELSCISLKVSLAALQRAELPPYLGSTLRGVIGQALLQTDKEICVFLYRNGEEAVGGKVIAKPYMIIPPDICIPQTVLEKGEKLDFEILLFGCAAEYTASVVSALEQLYRFGLGARRYRFELSGIINGQTQRMIWRQGQYYKDAVTSIPIRGYELQNVKGAVIKLCTPLRIRHGGRLVKRISFQTLIRNITNRVLALTERYGGWIDQEEADRLVVLAEKVRTVKEEIKVEHLERYSNRINGKMDFSGLLGTIEYEGDLTPFVPWLYATQRLHVGRNTTFGMGKIEVYFI